MEKLTQIFSIIFLLSLAAYEFDLSKCLLSACSFRHNYTTSILKFTSTVVTYYLYSDLDDFYYSFQRTKDQITEDLDAFFGDGVAKFVTWLSSQIDYLVLRFVVFKRRGFLSIVDNIRIYVLFY